MNNKIICSIVGLLSVLSLNTSANAMRVDLQLDKSIAHQFSFSYDIYNSSAPKNQQHQSLSAEGVDVNALSPFMGSMNAALASMTPVKPSSLTVGYVTRDGKSNTPASCANIPAKMMMTISMSVDGCTVS